MHFCVSAKRQVYISFIMSFKTIFTQYRLFSDFLSPKAGFPSLLRVTHYTQFEIDFLCSESLLNFLKVFSELN